MAKISQLTAVPSPLTGAEVVPLNQAGTTYRTTAQAIANLASGGSTSTSWLLKSTNYTLVAGNNVSDQTGGRTFVLPAATGSGAVVNIMDGLGNWGSSNSTVMGTVNGATNLILDVSGSSVRLVDVGGATGWRAD